MNQRQAIVIAMRFRPRTVSRRKWSDLTCRIHAVISNNVWRIQNPRMAWFAIRVTWHFRYGLPMPPMPAHSIEA